MINVIVIVIVISRGRFDRLLQRKGLECAKARSPNVLWLALRTARRLWSFERRRSMSWVSLHV